MNLQDLRIETERLILRPPRVEDFDGFAALMADERTARFIGGVQSRPEAWRKFIAFAGAWVIQGFSMFSVIEKSSGRWLGRLGPWRPEGWPGPEVGWALLRDAWGQGYATEGAAAAMDYAFDVLEWNYVVHTIAAENRPSRRLARRLGSCYLKKGRLPPPHPDDPIDIWGQTRASWHDRIDR